jgi:hypothetical protein
MLAFRKEKYEKIKEKMEKNLEKQREYNKYKEAELAWAGET